MSYRYSKRITLSEGDKIKVSQGPYYISSSGIKISMAEKGIAYFVCADEKNNGIFAKFGGSQRFLYLGQEYRSSDTGTIMRPYKITKLRK
jgi:hypothetical protein